MEVKTARKDTLCPVWRQAPEPKRPKKMNEKKIKDYLERHGISKWALDWTLDELKDRIADMPFHGEETGCLKFNRTKTGRRYIIFLPQRCYIDQKRVTTNLLEVRDNK